MPRFTVLASDYDGTLAHHGRVSAEAEAALDRFRAAGGLVVLVTGRRHEELEEVFPSAAAHLDLLVAENGGLLVDYPDESRRTLLGARLPEGLHQTLHESGVHVFETGELIVSAAREDEEGVRRAAAALADRWPCQVVPNKDRVMLLPEGIDKASGLAAALERLGLERADTVAVGDAENDLPLLRGAGLAVAVANSVPALTAVADRVTVGRASQGVIETIDELLLP